MKDLLEALDIFGRYADLQNPVHCEYSTMYIIGVERSMVSDADHKRLDDLGFFVEEQGDTYISYRFGSS